MLLLLGQFAFDLAGVALGVAQLVVLCLGPCLQGILASLRGPGPREGRGQLAAQLDQPLVKLGELDLGRLPSFLAAGQLLLDACQFLA
ncbi:hypothetical protein ACWCYL_31835 [Streptomyces sp. 900105755]|uniref:hypothetical protein n=1 Tax=Streptomyces sp. 900105755 TaxID=3154389 RepID=UPI00331899E9